MSEQSVPNPQQMEEEKILERIIDGIRSEKPNLAEALSLCAVPHWFNREILVWLQGDEAKSLEQAEAILYELRQNKLAFEHGSVYSLHGNVRKLLLRRWHNEDAARFRELSGKAAAYARVLMSGKLTREQRAEWERQEMYHILVSDEMRGIDLFINLINRASRLYQKSTFQLLINLAHEQTADLSASSRHWIRFSEGELAWLTGDWEKALKIWEVLEGEREQLPNLVKTLAHHLSFLYKDKGEWEKAIGCLKHSLEILEEAGDEHGMIATYNDLGFLYKDKDQWEEADKCFKFSLEILERVNDERGKADIFNNQGLLYKDREDWDKASECFNKSLKIMKSAGDEQGMAATYNNLGFLYKDWEKWEEADKYFRCSLETLEENSDELGRAATYKHLGFLYTDWKKWEDAHECFQQSLEILEEVGDKREIANTYSYLGFLYSDKEKWEESDGYFQHGLGILNEMGDEHGAATVLNNLGFLYKHKGENKKAVDYFQSGLKILVDIGDEMNAATAMCNIALLYEDLKRYNEAVELLEKVVKICDRVGHTDLKIRRSREILERIKEKAVLSRNASDQ